MALNIALWIVQGLLALVFLSSGVAKSTMSKDRLMATGQTGVAPYPLPFIRVIAAFEILGVFGLVLPGLLGIDPLLTPLAAAGLAAIMVGAGLSHWSIHERKQALLANLPLFALCVFVVAGRLVGL